jgi:quinol monooxygenase YgiN
MTIKDEPGCLAWATTNEVQTHGVWVLIDAFIHLQHCDATCPEAGRTAHP